jgi:TetR/AcrR family transcriptional regulator, regulator of cefoperazone and chloramphenicol sensitivity
MSKTNPDTNAAPASLAAGEAKDSRQRLLHAALRCFAQHGFEKTSTRMIAEAAGANVAAIRYYFGDKAGLYRAAFEEPFGKPQDDIALFADPGLSLEQALSGLYSGFIEPLKQGETAMMCTKLHMREMIEPTGLWQEEIAQGIKPYHEALVAVLSRHLGITEPDDDVHRLGFCIVAQAVYMFVGRDVMLAVRPDLIQSPQALERMHKSLTQNAMALVQEEKRRRAGRGKREEA